MDAFTQDQRIADYMARADIAQLKSLYGDIIDGIVGGRTDGDLERLLALFAEDAVVDFSSAGFLGIYRGHAEIGEVLTDTFRSNNQWMWHSFHNPIMDVMGDEARGRWTIYAHFLPRGSAEVVPFVGRYDDRFVRIDGVWKYSKLTLLTERMGV